jgi:inner membrane transporter RhtA
VPQRAIRQRRVAALPPHAYFVVSAVFHYLGPAFAVLLFARVDVLGVAWLRIVTAAAVFAAWRKPWRSWSDLDVEARRDVLAWGVVLAAMNSCFYISIDRLPLSTVAAIEFVGPILLAAVGVRSSRNALAVLFAAVGVYALTGVRLEGEPIGFAFAFANGALFTLYIVFGHRVSRAGASSGIDSLGLAMLFAALAAMPLGLWDAGESLFDPIAVLAGAGVGISSSVIPYVFDQLALARLARSTYSLFVSLLPATATVIGIIVLGQIPAARELLGVGLVVAGVAVHNRPSDTEPQDGRINAQGEFHAEG